MLGKSFIYNKNKSGPMTDPCGTPHVMLKISEQWPSTQTNCFLFGKYMINPIWTGGGGGWGNIEKKLSDFNFTPLMDILRILSITIVVRCCHNNLLFPVCHVIFWVEKTKKLELFSR